MSEATGPIGCPDCGLPISRQCAGHIKRTRGDRQPGHRCHQSARQGANVCDSHGGRARQVRAAAGRRVAESAAVAAFERETGGAAPVDLLTALERTVGEVRHWADFVGARVTQLTAGQWSADDPRVAAELSLYERALSRAGRLLTDVSRLALDERQRAYEREADERYRARFEREQREAVTKLTAMTDRMLAGLGLNPHDRAVRAWVYAHIRGETPPPPLPLPLAQRPGSAAPSFMGAPGTPGHPFPAGWRQQPYGYGHPDWQPGNGSHG